MRPEDRKPRASGPSGPSGPSGRHGQVSGDELVEQRRTMRADILAALPEGSVWRPVIETIDLTSPALPPRSPAPIAAAMGMHVEVLRPMWRGKRRYQRATKIF